MISSVVLLIVVVGILVYSFLRIAKRRIYTDDEFERGSSRPSLLRTGLVELQGFLEPDKGAAVRALEREQRKTEVELSCDPPVRGSRDGGS